MQECRPTSIRLGERRASALRAGLRDFAAFDTIPLWAIASLKAGGLDLTRADLAITLTVASGVQVVYSFRFMASFFMEGRGLRGSLVTAACAGASTLMFIPILGGLVAPLRRQTVIPRGARHGLLRRGDHSFFRVRDRRTTWCGAPREATPMVSLPRRKPWAAAGPTFGAVVLATGFSRHHGGFAAFWCLAPTLLLAVAVARNCPSPSRSRSMTSWRRSR